MPPVQLDRALDLPFGPKGTGQPSGWPGRSPGGHALSSFHLLRRDHLQRDDRPAVLPGVLAGNPRRDWVRASAAAPLASCRGASGALHAHPPHVSSLQPLWGLDRLSAEPGRAPGVVLGRGVGCWLPSRCASLVVRPVDPGRKSHLALQQRRGDAGRRIESRLALESNPKAVRASSPPAGGTLGSGRGSGSTWTRPGS